MKMSFVGLSFARGCIDHMIGFNTTCVAATLTLTGALAGCATFGKCGLDGCPGDAKITAEVTMLLDQHPELEGSNAVYVQTLDHEVFLNGLVDTPFQRETAESAARRAPGVTGVVDMIGVNNDR